ncbi:MAG: molybdopterin-dependent oxidoreductase, partial [Pseudomonadota bacterium]
MTEAEVTDYQCYTRRREFIKKATGTLAAIGTGLPTLAQSKVDISNYQKAADNPLADEITKEIKVTSYNNFYELGTGKGDPLKNAHLLKTEPWAITVDGECDNPGVLAIEDFISPHQIEERIYRFRCVEAWSMVVPWLGVELGPVLKRFQPNSKAKYVGFTTILDPENLPGQRRDILDWPYPTQNRDATGSLLRAVFTQASKNNCLAIFHPNGRDKSSGGNGRRHTRIKLADWRSKIR